MRFSPTDYDRGEGEEKKKYKQTQIVRVRATRYASKDIQSGITFNRKIIFVYFKGSSV